jgi:hypothetical protein
MGERLSSRFELLGHCQELRWFGVRFLVGPRRQHRAWGRRGAPQDRFQFGDGHRLLSLYRPDRIHAHRPVSSSVSKDPIAHRGFRAHPEEPRSRSPRSGWPGWDAGTVESKLGGGQGELPTKLASGGIGSRPWSRLRDTVSFERAVLWCTEAGERSAALVP